ncbi:hypothetical protein E2562_030049 [Oryza meyeriana var. granulata]|uniref:Uncharacterized protein n=1 Tax=Oryza meyeriana var. granulata TaxID=110450 RepID=A0A6G1CJM5_9ORYZ|nr:hypothetical protein E2562_030049 [Oryza meyeriana var. granulata]
MTFFPGHSKLRSVEALNLLNYELADLLPHRVVTVSSAFADPPPSHGLAAASLSIQYLSSYRPAVY